MPKNQFNLKDVQNLQQLRDELLVRAHLFKSEVKEEWEKLEKQWSRLAGDLAPAQRAAKASALQIKDATGLLFNTVKEGYERIKRSLPS